MCTEQDMQLKNNLLSGLWWTNYVLAISKLPQTYFWHFGYLSADIYNNTDISAMTIYRSGWSTYAYLKYIRKNWKNMMCVLCSSVCMCIGGLHEWGRRQTG